jgi:hypothetical protein
VIAFVDETGLNPLPAGLQVSVYPATGPQNASTLVGTAWLAAGGTANITVENAVSYVAVFFGRQAPQTAQTFVGGSGTTTTATVQAYRSPTLSLQGYTAEHVNLWPKGDAWFGEAAGQLGGEAYAVAYGLSAVLATMDGGVQYELERIRAQSSIGPDLDSWFADFLGKYVTRLYGELDPSFYGRGVAALSSNKTTIAALQAIVTLFYQAIAQQMATSAVPNLSYDGFGSFDGSGGYDATFAAPSAASMVPFLDVWDRQSRPDLANLYNVNPNNDDGSFVIQIGLTDPLGQAWFLDQSYLDCTTFLAAGADEATITTVAPDPRLGTLVNFVKAAGAKPLYLVYQEA